MKRKTEPCPACGFRDREVCKIIGHIYPLGNTLDTPEISRTVTHDRRLRSWPKSKSEPKPKPKEQPK